MTPRSPAQRALPLGTRVRLNEEGKKYGLPMPNRSGLVSGYTRDGERVYVQWDGQATAQTWSCYMLTEDRR